MKYTRNEKYKLSINMGPLRVCLGETLTKKMRDGVVHAAAYMQPNTPFGDHYPVPQMKMLLVADFFIGRKVLSRLKHSGTL